MAESFTALGNAGRIPLKLGHDDAQPVTDGQPALGWVTKVWREGSSLFATFSGMPAAIYESVKKGLYKFVSVEILRGVQAAGRTWPAVLDAVALLGASRPAVTNLQELSKLAATRAERPMVFDALQAFSTEFAPTVDDAEPARESYTAKIVALTKERDAFAAKATAADAELVAFKARIDREEFTRRAREWVLDRSVTPAMVALVEKRLKDPAVRQHFCALDLLTSMRQAPGTHGFAPGLQASRTPKSGDAAAVSAIKHYDNGPFVAAGVIELAEATREYARQKGCDVFAAMGAVARARMELSEPIMDQHQQYRERFGWRPKK